MLSINTNLSGLIAQNSLTTSTDKLNQAIERMTTGLKINHASDNAANYSISTNLTTQLSAYDIAADNVANGMDLVGYANDIISQMQDKAARLNALSTQARNGTYGGKSLDALNSEASAIMAEITRLYNTAEYNDISLFNKKEYTIAPHLPQAGESGFIDETALVSPAGAGPTTEAPTAKAEYNGFIADPVSKPQSEVDALTSVTGANGTLNESEYKVASVEDLVELANLVNSGVDTTGKTFYLAKDLDLGAYCDAEIANGNGGWTPIGTPMEPFRGTFDGNGHVIKNLKIDREASIAQGLFGFTISGKIKNIALNNAVVKGDNNVGCLGGKVLSEVENCYAIGEVIGVTQIGLLFGGGYNVSNSYAFGNVLGDEGVGGLAGVADTITNSYATGTVTGQISVGGLVGEGVEVFNSYATAVVTGQDSVGGLVGDASSTISNSYATGAVTGQGGEVGGLAGDAGSISNSYATGAVTGQVFVGGLAGGAGSISNSYATGAVTVTGNVVGGLAGVAVSITNSYATGDVTVTGNEVGGLVGYSDGCSISNSYAIGNVTGRDYVGGILGAGESNSSISNSYSTGVVVGRNYIGGLSGRIMTIVNSYATGSVIGQDYVGGLAGETSNVNNSYVTGNVSGESYVGGLAGQVISLSGTSITDSVSYSKVIGADSASTGSLIGGAVMTSDGTSFGTLDITNCQARPIEGMNEIGNAFHLNGTIINFDLSSALAGIDDVQLNKMSTDLQVGIYGNDSCQLNFDTNFNFNEEILAGGIESVEAFDAIVEFEKLLSDKATMLGAVQNRLDSALESIEVNINNLTSSRSTIRDADIAEVSSEYIKQQILQQASATLMATANQAPAIALQLI